MPPQDVINSDPAVQPEVTVISSGKAKPAKKPIFIGLSLLLLVIGIASSVFLVQRRQQIQIAACDCSLYNFFVSQTGTVTVTNNQDIAEPAQKATVIINGSTTETFEVPALGPHENTTLGTVTVPDSGTFSWSVTGSLFCSDSGSYVGVSPTPTPITPTPTSPPVQYNCTLYNFSVSRQGIVSITNGMSSPAPSQQADVFIDGVKKDTFPVPALPPGQSAQLGSVTVPSSEVFVWRVHGSVACTDEGRYRETSPTPSPTIKPPTATPTRPVPTSTRIPSNTPIPSTTPIPSSTPVPTATAAPISPTPTSKIDPPPAAPNRCNGSCTTDNNCTYGEDGTKLTCVNGLCRHPSCTDQESCHCPPAYAAAPTATPKPAGTQLAQSGSVSTTLFTGLAGILIISLGFLLAL